MGGAHGLGAHSRRIGTVGDGAQRDVAVGEDLDQLVAAGHQGVADVLGTHELRGVHERGVRGDHDDARLMTSPTKSAMAVQPSCVPRLWGVRTSA